MFIVFTHSSFSYHVGNIKNVPRYPVLRANMVLLYTLTFYMTDAEPMHKCGSTNKTPLKGTTLNNSHLVRRTRLMFSYTKEDEYPSSWLVVSSFVST